MSARFNLNAQPFTPAGSPAGGVGGVKQTQSPTPSQQPAGPARDNAKKQTQKQTRKHGGQNQKKARKDARPRKEQGSRSANATPVSQGPSLAEQINAQSRNKRGEVSISHLLDISLAPRPRQDAGAPPRRNRKTRAVAVDKATYINSTCRFIVDDRLIADWLPLARDPDAIVPLHATLRIVSVPTGCPICMEERAEAPRMLACGHIMCYPCYFRFAAAEAEEPPAGTTKKKSALKECPLCFERIRPSDLVPVTFTATDGKLDVPRPGHDAVMRLMFRPADSSLAVPADDTAKLTARDFAQLPSATALYDITNYSRVVRGNVAYAVDELRRDISELTEAKENSATLYGDSGEWYDKAIQAINASIRDYESGGASASASASASVSSPASPALPSSSDSYNFQGDIPAALTAIDSPDVAMSQLSLDDPSSRLDIEAQYNDANAYYFYQTGFEALLTRYFLAPLDVRLLKRTFGAYSSFPTALVPKVEHIYYESGVTPDLRKRIKYLSHLPTHSSVGFLECDWRGVLPEDALAPFAKEFKERRQKRREQERRDERTRKRLERQEEERLRRELLQEAPVAGPEVRTYSNSGTRPTFEFEPGPALPSTHESTPAVEDSDQSLSFAAAAAAAPSDETKEIQSLMKGAVSSKKGKKKYIVLSR